MSHPIGRFWLKKWSGPEEPLNAKLKAISHAFRRPRDPCTKCRGCLQGTCDGIFRTLTTLNRHKNNFYKRFGVVPCLHEKIINGWFGDILGKSDGAMHPGSIESCAAPHRNDQARRNPKMVKIESYKSHFLTSLELVRRMSWDGSRGHYILKTPTTWNGHKNNFYDCFGDILWLHHKIIKGWFVGILGQVRCCKALGMHYKSYRAV